MASIPTNELNNISTTYNTKVGNRWDGRGRQQGGAERKLSLGLGLRLGFGLGLRQGPRLGLGLGFRLGFGLGFRLGFPLDIGEWQVSRGSKHPRRA